MRRDDDEERPEPRLPAVPTRHDWLRDRDEEYVSPESVEAASQWDARAWHSERPPAR